MATDCVVLEGRRSGGWSCILPGRARQGRGRQVMTPNTRVQRTRSSPSALREPLTRRRLGGVRTTKKGHT